MSVSSLRASVRQMVEFSLRGGDLVPASAAAMAEGSRAHRARQGSVSAHAERAVRWQGSCDGVEADIQGRIDLLWEDADPLCIDELKLISPYAPLPVEPLPTHRMQAVCYGYMLAEELDLPEVCVQVSYVTETGAVRAYFEETLSRDTLTEQFFAMLRPLAAWHRLQCAHQEARDASLQALRFPYDHFRPGQREMAAQVYTAIRRQKRLFATLPTGTGKSAATLFPALKALGNGLTKQIFYLTARGTAQLSALDALGRMEGAALRSVVLTAREKCCPQSPMRCHPDFCPRAKGYYDRELPALMEACKQKKWEDLQAFCDKWALCPFEFSLALCEISDVVICDYNYVFDPLVSLKRIIGQGKPVTLLMDEAHNLPGRARDMLSARLDSREVAEYRREIGKKQGRKHPLYLVLTAFLKLLRNAEEPAGLLPSLEALIGEMASNPGEGDHDFFRQLLSFRMALNRYSEAPEGYRVLIDPGTKERSVTLLCLDISSHLEKITRRMTGCVYFSATLEPLDAMRGLLGGNTEDALFALPSPFPPERLLVMTHPLPTRYQQRADSAGEAAACILALYSGHAGKYVAYFPSYAYLSLIREKLLALAPDLPLNVQDRAMEPEARDSFLRRMREADGPLLSLCVLGGIFAEGIDLPGDQLIGVAVVGVGLPQVNEMQEALRAHYEEKLGDGFGFAYRNPGMQKVMQAAGRVIRSETDAGVVLLLDSRYQESAYARLLPPHYHPAPVANADEIRGRTQDFWRLYGIKETL
ncbi:MAG: ATP-dependent DNA helicase [Clostridia bacterium]|nr:ATP-dependent DNA helicase [Clostridia bacterium]